MSGCEIDNCGRPLANREPALCAMHHARWRKHGDPTVVKPPGFPKSPRTPCIFPGCGSPSKRGGRGWCGKHYTRWFRHGDPSVDGNKLRKRQQDHERVLARVVPAQDGCWIWTGFLLPSGYGSLSYTGEGRKRGYPHRIMWEWRHGPLPAGLQVHHDCGQRACCNPDHLRAVTPREHAQIHVRLRRKAPA